ncbi:MAG: hypothetical protein ACI9N9_002841 [Enterobacterales bacterium]|jgi:hypothetical protein
MNTFPYKYRLALILSTLFVITGCSVAPPKPGISASLDGLIIYSATSDMQSAFLKSSSSGEHFCDSRMSDVADTESVSVGLGYSAVGLSEGINEGASRGAVSLGGRSPAVLITREVMYRTCEMVMNLDLNKKEALDLYIHTLNLVKSVALSDTGTGTASIVGSAPTEDTMTSSPTIINSATTDQDIVTDIVTEDDL